MTREEFNNTKWHKGMKVKIDSYWMPNDGSVYEITGVDFGECLVEIDNCMWIELCDIISLVSEEGGNK